MSFSHLPALLATCFARLAARLDLRCARRLPRLLCGLLLARGRRTCTAWFRAAGITDEFRRAYTVLWACGRHARSLAHALLPTLDPVLAGTRLLLAIDDTPTARWGPCIEGAGLPILRLRHGEQDNASADQPDRRQTVICKASLPASLARSSAARAVTNAWRKSSLKWTTARPAERVARGPIMRRSRSPIRW